MPVDHLFRYSDLEILENNPPVGKFKILVVGTFNGDIEGNIASWFYGRPENEFWCLFPRMLELPTLHPVDRGEPIEELTHQWKNFCSENKIIIVDIFKSVNVDLPNHADANLEHLQQNQFTEFNFEQAFANCTFENVMFTWKGEKNNTLTDFKIRYTNYFQEKESRIIHLVTPSNAYSKPRSFKLNSWIESYGN